MANQNGNVADPVYPGQVLEPNDPLPGIQQDDLSAFGTELEPPVQAPVNAAPQNPQDQKRYEYWQSQANKAAADLKALQEQFRAVEPVLPLINVIQKDAELQDKVRTHLGGKKTPEAPQRPDSYSDVEAYSNPQSDSFKYRVAKERYTEEKIAALERQNQEMFASRQQEFEQFKQRQAQEQAQLRLQQEFQELGMQPGEFPEVMNLVNNASKEDIFNFYQWKKGRASAPRYDVPSSGYASRPSSNQLPSGPIDIGADIIALAKQMR